MTERRCGDRATYQAGCRCLPCRAANAAYWSQWHRAKQAGRPLLGQYVSAIEARRRVAQLLIERFTYAELSRRLGLKSGRLKLHHQQQITLRTHLKVRRLYRQIMAEGPDQPHV